MRSRLLIITGMAVILLVAAFCGVWSISRRQSVRLPGGEALALVAVTQGKTNVFMPGGL
jgi:hypothetical protein